MYQIKMGFRVLSALWVVSALNINKKLIKCEKLSSDNGYMNARDNSIAERCVKIVCVTLAYLHAIFWCFQSGVSLHTSFALAGAVFLTFQHRGLLSLSVLSFLFLTLQASVLALQGSGDWGPVLAPITLLAITFLSLNLTPYNGRTGLLGRGDRVPWKSVILIKVDEIEIEAETVNMSMSGIKIQWEDHFPLLKLGQTVLLRIPEAKGFESLGQLASINPQEKWAAFKFIGWSLSSVRQHLKLKSHIDFVSKPKAGYSLIEMLLAMGIGAVVLVGINQTMVQMVKSQSEIRRRYWIETLRTEIINAVRNPSAWSNTIQSSHNGSMACLRDRTSCDPAVNNGSIEIRDNDNRIIFDSTSAASGFTVGGLPCSDFDPVNGNDSCPLRFDITWVPTCAGACVNPEIKIAIRLEYKPQKQNGVINLNRESFTFYRNPLADSLETTCASLNGVFDSATGGCQWIRVASTCSESGQLFVGFDSDGNELCEPLQAKTCPAGTWMKGVDLNGDLVCQAG